MSSVAVENLYKKMFYEQQSFFVMIIRHKKLTLIIGLNSKEVLV